MKETDKLEGIKDNFPYKDILHLKHPEPKNHTRQPRINRAGQFSPFAALTGYGEAIQETTRVTEDEIHLDEERKQQLDETLSIISSSDKPPKVTVEYFEKDNKKQGGKYSKKIGYIKRIDTYYSELTFDDKEKIKLENIVNISIIDFQ